MNREDIQRLILGSTLAKIMYIFADDGPTREFFPIDRIRSDTGSNDVIGFVVAHAGDEKISLYFNQGLEVQADIWGNGALKTIRRIKNEYLPAHYPMIKIIERTIITKNT